MICTIGDLLLDVVVALDRPIDTDTDTFVETYASPGGQAANVATWVVALGGCARFVGKRARDPAGRILREELERRGVELAGPEVDGVTGTVVSLTAADGSRSMLTDRGVATGLAPGDLEAEWFEGCDWLHISGYSLVESPLREAVGAAAASARRARARVSVDVSSTAAIRRLGVDRFAEALHGLAPDVIFGNEEEIELAGAEGEATVLVKRGARGCLVRSGAGTKRFPARPARVVDTTGAGDAFAAGYLLGGVELALDAAARCVGMIGAVPPSIAPDDVAGVG